MERLQGSSSVLGWNDSRGVIPSQDRKTPGEAFCPGMNNSGELIVSRYVAESITMIAGRFGHVGLCQLRTKLKKLQRETSYIAITGQWCGVIKSGCLNDQ